MPIEEMWGPGGYLYQGSPGNWYVPGTGAVRREGGFGVPNVARGWSPGSIVGAGVTGGERYNRLVRIAADVSGVATMPSGMRSRQGPAQYSPGMGASYRPYSTSMTAALQQPTTAPPVAQLPQLPQQPRQPRLGAQQPSPQMPAPLPLPFPVPAPIQITPQPVTQLPGMISGGIQALPVGAPVPFQQGAVPGMQLQQNALLTELLRLGY